MRSNGSALASSSSSPAAERQRVGRGTGPARRLGLSEREAEIVSLITHGLGNEDIADRLFLSINTVKSYIRTAYRKMGVTTRSQAVLWGVDHGFKKPVSRIRPRVHTP